MVLIVPWRNFFDIDVCAMWRLWSLWSNLSYFPLTSIPSLAHQDILPNFHFYSQGSEVGRWSTYIIRTGFPTFWHFGHWPKIYKNICNHKFPKEMGQISTQFDIIVISSWHINAQFKFIYNCTGFVLNVIYTMVIKVI